MFTKENAYNIKWTTELATKLERIIDEINSFNEFEHSLDIDENKEIYDNFMGMLIDLTENWQDSIDELVKKIPE